MWGKVDEKTLSARAALLDFYADRAAGFASLFLASMFGLVTVLAIALAVNGDGMPPLVHGVSVFFSLLCYGGFALAGWYIWRRFALYADLAEKLQFHGIHDYAKFQQVNIGTTDEKKQNDKDSFYLYLHERCQKQDKFWLRELLKEHFDTLYIIIIVLLGVSVYLPVLWRL